jgi:hypothetical protein
VCRGPTVGFSPRRSSTFSDAVGGSFISSDLFPAARGPDVFPDLDLFVDRIFAAMAVEHSKVPQQHAAFLTLLFAHD